MGRSGRRGGLSHGPRLLRPNPPCGPRSPGSASVPRERLGPPQGDSATKSVLVPHLLGTNHPRRDQPRRPLQRATPAATTTATAATRKKQFGTNRGERRTARTTATRPGRITARLAAGGLSRAPRSPAGGFCSQVRPRTQPPGDQPTPKGPPVAAGAEGSRTTMPGQRRGAGPQRQASGVQRHPWGRTQHSPTLTSEHGAGFGAPPNRAHNWAA